MADSVSKVIRPREDTGKITRNIVIAAMLILILYAVSIFFYHKFEGWGYLDATYFVTMTITTIGYGDLVPKTTEGKLFTMFIAFTGISLAFLLIASIATYREKAIDKHFAGRLSILKSISVLQREPENNKRRPKNKIESLTKLPEQG